MFHGENNNARSTISYGSYPLHRGDQPSVPYPTKYLVQQSEPFRHSPLPLTSWPPFQSMQLQLLVTKHSGTDEEEGYSDAVDPGAYSYSRSMETHVGEMNTRRYTSLIWQGETAGMRLQERECGYGKSLPSAQRVGLTHLAFSTGKEEDSGSKE